MIPNKKKKNRIYLGPYDGREPELLNEVEGILSNPNCEYEANFVPLKSLSLWIHQTLKTPYDPRRALTECIKDWLPEFGTCAHPDHVIQLEDVALLCDTFYLPHRHGDQAQ